MDIPPVPAPFGWRSTRCSVRWSPLDMDAAHLGPSSIPKQFARYLYLTIITALAIMARRPIPDRCTYARCTELRCDCRGSGESRLRRPTSFRSLSLFQFMQDGKEEFLSQTVHITIAPVANVDTSFSSTSRRPSLVSEGPRRMTGDSIVPQTSPSR
jgi:hypothetical protein